VQLDLGRGAMIAAHELGELTAAAVARFSALACIAEGGGQWRGKRAGGMRGGLEGAVTRPVDPKPAYDCHDASTRRRRPMAGRSPPVSV
jgi:hypothetical protein